MTIMELIREFLEDEGFWVETFEEAGFLTRDEGLVIKTEDGEYQVIIVKSK